MFLRVEDYIKTCSFQSESPNSLPHDDGPAREIKAENQSVQKQVILRHDVDARPQNSLRLAYVEHSLGIHGTYYFRMPHTFHPPIIKEIAALGHEVGYHYETMAQTKKGREQGQEQEDHFDRAYELFVENLEKLRTIVPVTTICMHGSPLSRFDNREIWKKYDYRELGIIGDAYIDIDFTQVAYFTDTGRRWNGAEVSIRDKVSDPYKFHLKTTEDLIGAIPQFPEKVMITIHPQRWNDAPLPWTGELLLQNTKNIIKRILVKTGVSNRT